MRTAYRRIFQRCGLETIPVEADTGAMGGSDSEEFMVASEVGEEALLLCDACGYKANREKAEYRRSDKKPGEAMKGLSEVATPGVKTIDDLVGFFKCRPDKFLKSIVYVADRKPVMAVVPGDREINEPKLARAAGASQLELAPDAVVEEVTGAPVGFAGPVTNKNLRIIYDLSVKSVVNGITGANKKDLHFDGVNPGRDFVIKESADITSAEEGDDCPKCGTKMYMKKGIEVGHIFKLGYKYTKTMNVTVLNENGQEVTPIMGCYGIGINRTMAAIVEQHNDDKGIIWPLPVAPFSVHLIALGKSDEEIKETDAIYDMLCAKGLDVLYDDRASSPGFKFADADLIGIPVRVTIGKNYFKTGEAEVKMRKGSEILKVKKEHLAETIRKCLQSSNMVSP
jgi:prolyl-tRNA synthetase